MRQYNNKDLSGAELLSLLVALSQTARQCRETRASFERFESCLDELTVTRLEKVPPFICTGGLGHEIRAGTGLIPLQGDVHTLGQMADEAIAELFKLAWVLDEAIAGGAGPNHPDPENGRIQIMSNFMAEVYPELMDCIPEPCGPEGGRENVHYFQPVEGQHWYEAPVLDEDGHFL